MSSCLATKTALLIGCGHDRRRRIRSADEPEGFENFELTTLDINPICGADVIHDMAERPLPFPDESFDEIACYDVLEHWGSFGDWRGWFDEMAEYHRLLKPGGEFAAVVPIGEHTFADPGHVRVFHQNHFGFLTREFYENNRRQHTAATDYTWYIKRWWEIRYLDVNEVLSVILQKV